MLMIYAKPASLLGGLPTFIPMVVCTNHLRGLSFDFSRLLKDFRYSSIKTELLQFERGTNQQNRFTEPQILCMFVHERFHFAIALESHRSKPVYLSSLEMWRHRATML